MSDSLPENPPTKKAKIEEENTTQATLQVRDSDEDLVENCSICLQSMEDRTIIPTCSHEFCFDCLVVWTAQSRRCPLCTQTMGDYVIHGIRSRFDYQKHHLAPLRSNSPQLLLPPQTTAAIEARDAARRRRRERERERRQRGETDERDKLQMSITTRRWVYKHDLYAKHVASNSHTKYRPYPTPAQFASSQDLISRTATFLRRELQVWQGLDVEFLTNLILSLMKSIDIRSESAVRLLAEFLDLDAPYTAGSRHVNAEHFVHEVYCYVRSPYRNLFIYDTIVQYDHPRNISPPPSMRQQSARWAQSRGPSRSRGQDRNRSRSPSRSPRQERGRPPLHEQQGRVGSRRHSPISATTSNARSPGERSEEGTRAVPMFLEKQRARSCDRGDLTIEGNYGDVGSGSEDKWRRGLVISGDSNLNSRDTGQSSDVFALATFETVSPAASLEREGSSVPPNRQSSDLRGEQRAERRSWTPEFQGIGPGEWQEGPPPHAQKKDVISRLEGSRRKSHLESIQTYIKTNPPLPRSMEPFSADNTPPTFHAPSGKFSRNQNHPPLSRRLSSPVTNATDQHSTWLTSHLDHKNDNKISALSSTPELASQATPNSYLIKEGTRSNARESSDSLFAAADAADRECANRNLQRPSALDGSHQDNTRQTSDGQRTFATLTLDMRPPSTSNPRQDSETGRRDIVPTNSYAPVARIRTSDDKCLNSIDGKEEERQSDKAHVGSALYHAAPILTHGPPNSAPFISPLDSSSKKTLRLPSEIRSKLLSRLEQEKEEAMNSQKTYSAFGEDKREKISISGSPTDTGGSSASVKHDDTLMRDAVGIRTIGRSGGGDPSGLNPTSTDSRAEASMLEARLRARAKLQAKLAVEKRLGTIE